MSDEKERYVWVCESFLGIALPKVTRYVVSHKTGTGYAVRVRGGQRTIRAAQGRKMFEDEGALKAYLKARAASELDIAEGQVRRLSAIVAGTAEVEIDVVPGDARPAKGAT